MTWRTHSEATSERLKKIVLANGLVNIRGLTNFWFEIDRMNEFLNLRLKLAMRFRHSSTEPLLDLFTRVALLSEYLAQVKASVEGLAGEKTNATHRMKKAQADVTRLAYHLLEERVPVDQGKRESHLKPLCYDARAMGVLEPSLQALAAQYCDRDVFVTCTVTAGEDNDKEPDVELEEGDIIDDADVEGMLPFLDNDADQDELDIDAGGGGVDDAMDLGE
ncbi:hypothetical protein KEM55_002963 [Ascosphaera atra]|nr:hypothetical protein KEM55_002963 [Ascosphaera atra]